MANKEEILSFDMDMESLASQAIKLFRKRYGKLYDTHMGPLDVDKKGYLTYEEYEKWSINKYTPTHTEEKAKEVAYQTWYDMTGGCSPADIPQLSRQQSIDLTLKGCHGKDKDHHEKLRQNIYALDTFHFKLMDKDNNGFISMDEWQSWAEETGDIDHWKGAFEAMDLNGDGQISLDEWLQCILGFRFHIDQDRYNHFFGPLDQ